MIGYNYSEGGRDSYALVLGISFLISSTRIKQALRKWRGKLKLSQSPHLR
jgi:hypothetical protein